MKRLTLFPIILFLISCSQEFNVEYQICDVNMKNCNTSVIFKSLEQCERYKTFDISYCDKVTVPGKMICDTSKKYEERLTSFCKVKN